MPRALQKPLQSSEDSNCIRGGGQMGWVGGVFCSLLIHEDPFKELITGITCTVSVLGLRETEGFPLIRIML